jgi:hypothetical protein
MLIRSLSESNKHYVTSGRTAAQVYADVVLASKILTEDYGLISFERIINLTLPRGATPEQIAMYLSQLGAGVGQVIRYSKEKYFFRGFPDGIRSKLFNGNIAGGFQGRGRAATSEGGNDYALGLYHDDWNPPAISPSNS